MRDDAYGVDAALMSLELLSSLELLERGIQVV
jgi:hypothetical protein